MRPATKANLTEQIGTPYPRALMHCEVCGQDYSANRGDYLAVSESYTFRHCGRQMVLAVRQEVYLPA